MTELSLLDDFAWYGYGNWHCRHCHKLVRTDDNEQEAALQAHVDFNCTDTRSAVTHDR